MNTLAWVLVGVAAFWLGAGVLKARGLLPDRVKVYGPLVTLHTKRGRALLNRIARPKRLWRAWGNFGLGVALVVMFGSLLFLAVQAVLIVANPPEPTAANQPQNVLVIPGVNDFLPLSVAPEILFGLALGLVVHEAGHGILCRVEDIDIDSLGLFFITVLPAGAFVEPDRESQFAASRGGRARMFAAGVTNNFVLTVVAFLLLFGPIAGAIAVAPGAAVGGTLPGTAADRTSLDRGDRIVAVDGRRVPDNAALPEVLAETDAGTVTLRLASGETVAVDRSVQVIASTPVGPANLALNETITAVNGTGVETLAGLRAAFRNHTVVSVTNATGSTKTFPAGALTPVNEDGPLWQAGARGTVVITRVGDARVASMDDLSAALASHRPGDEVAVEAYRNGTRQTYDVTLGEGSGPDDAFLGVSVALEGVTGTEFTDVGVQPYPAANYLCMLGGSCDGTLFQTPGFLTQVFYVLVFPIVGLIGTTLFPFNFAGFAGGVQNFYTVTGPLEPLGGWVLVLANLLFWTGWINIQVGLFNCIPTFALDGGAILRAVAEAVVSRLPVDADLGRRLVTGATLAVQLVMLASLFLLLFGAQLLN